ncbi:MAG: hypothetical protein WC587_01690 [Candidatus Paceibacterota bacterium]
MTKVLAGKIENQGAKKLFGIVIFVIIMAGCFYLYFLGATIKGIINSSDNTKRLQTVSSEYQQLEENYYTLLGRFNLEYAHSLGFVDQPKNEFAVREIAVAQR